MKAIPAIDERRRIREALEASGFDAIICALPINVLMLSGYWPELGTAAVIAMRDGEIIALAPDDEEELASRGWCDRIITFSAGSLDSITDTTESFAHAFDAFAANARLEGGTIGIELGEFFTPVPYAAINVYGDAIRSLVRDAFPNARVAGADAMLGTLRMLKTPYEIERIRIACSIAAEAFEYGARLLRCGISERAAAFEFRRLLCEPRGISVPRADGFAWCMSGPNGAKAYRSYQQSSARAVERDDLLLIHCNSFADGYWTDITRTYAFSPLDSMKHSMFEAILAARSAALAAAGPGVPASEVDRAARDVLRGCGYGPAFRHPTGHGVGFEAIDHTSHPLIHPLSHDLLRSGMVFNIEPGIYIDGYGGMRHCDVVAITDDGAELLTPFHATLGELVLDR